MFENSGSFISTHAWGSEFRHVPSQIESTQYQTCYELEGFSSCLQFLCFRKVIFKNENRLVDLDFIWNNVHKFDSKDLDSFRNFGITLSEAIEHLQLNSSR